MQIKPVKVCTIEAPCKINLHLSIGEKRPDGFHNLSGLFVSLAFSDTIRFEITEKGDCHHLEDDNLILRAISLFRRQTGLKFGLNIHLDKSIPVGAGLGGGSSDAASTLLALNQFAGYAGVALPTEELMEMAAFLGSDVPFFIKAGGAFVSGRGEFVEPVELPKGLWVVLAMPPFPSDTALAYRRLDKMREHGAGVEKKPEIGRELLSRETLIHALKDESGNWPFYNDFLPVFLSPYSSIGFVEGRNEDLEDFEDIKVIEEKAATYRAILNSLQVFGASFSGLSGAGSCCFGLFNEKEGAEKAVKGLSAHGNFARLTFFLAHRRDPVLE